MNTQGKYYLGRIFDPQAGKTTGESLLYDPADLTTHAVVVGMTGSGKTGLCIDLLEEAALNNVPALMIDPKGDITNALLHFPQLRPQDFQPWVNPDEARREGKTIEEAAAGAAALWRQGLAQWDIQPERLQALANAAHFAIYTPGSDAGIPVSILASLKAPQLAWEAHQEVLREKISGTVTAILGLVGLDDIDPVRSREHILLANIFEAAWKQNRDLSLSELILQTQSPPFEKLGVFDINTFFPEKDRFDLAMLLNNILAAPAFQSWITGQPLDIPALLYGSDGRPRHSVFYIAHLSDAERMFFVTLLYSAVETWMRTQKGTSSLRAIVYFDEIFGYLPPTQNPPSKQPMLRMLKQARAFGVGQVLVTQNPVDVDYKALSNAGSWFIGKLQTEQDKERLLDGLESAMAGGMDRSEYDRLISKLGKRVFLLHNVHEKHPLPFQTRWAMNYLAGPLTRTQIPALNALVGAGLNEPGADTAPSAAVQPGRDHLPPAAASIAAAGRAVSGPPQAQKDALAAYGSLTRPSVPGRVAEYFLPYNLTLPQAFKSESHAMPPDVRTLGLVYRPVLLAQASIRYLKRNYNLDYQASCTALVPEPDRRGVVRWEEHLLDGLEPDRLDEKPAPGARFRALEAPLNDDKIIRSLESDFIDWAYRSATVTVRANEKLGIFAGPDMPQAEFRRMCSEAARRGLEDELEQERSRYEKKIDTIQERLQREERELREDEAELSQRRMEEYGTHAENLLSLFSKRRSRKISTSLSKRRMTEKARSDVEESQDAIENYKKQIEALEKEMEQALEDVQNNWRDIVEDTSEITVAPYKKDILVELFGVAWMPFHIVHTGETELELPGFGSD